MANQGYNKTIPSAIRDTKHEIDVAEWASVPDKKKKKGKGATTRRFEAKGYQMKTENEKMCTKSRVTDYIGEDDEHLARMMECISSMEDAPPDMSVTIELNGIKPIVDSCTECCDPIQGSHYFLY